MLSIFWLMLRWLRISLSNMLNLQEVFQWLNILICCLSKVLSKDFTVTCMVFSKVYALSIQSIQFSYSVVSDSWWPHGLHYARLPCLCSLDSEYLNAFWNLDENFPNHQALLSLCLFFPQCISFHWDFTMRRNKNLSYTFNTMPRSLLS